MKAYFPERNDLSGEFGERLNSCATHKNAEEI